MCADIAHGIASSPHWTGVSVAPMLQTAIMQAGLVWLQFNRYGPVVVTLRPDDLRIEYILALIDWFVI